MIVLPFPASALSGHNTGHWRVKAAHVAKHRQWAHHATLAAKPVVPADGDIPILFRFVPPDRRGDRTNYPNRLKAYIDGIADALGVNDRRFLPSYEFAAPEAPGRVEVSFPPHYPQTSTGGVPYPDDSGPVDGLPPDEQEAA